MVLIYTKGNVLDKGYDVVLHQANCLNVMGGGIAREISRRFPEVYMADKNFGFRPGEERLGRFSYEKVYNEVSDKNMFVVNVYGQNLIHGEGPLGDGVLTYYDKLEEGLRCSIEHLKENFDVTSFGVPYLMGCNLARGDWNKVSKILNDISKDLEVDIHVSEFTP